MTKRIHPSPLTVDQIVEGVAMRTGIERADIVGPSRRARLVIVRAATWYLCRKLTNLSYLELADAFGRPAHSTILEAVKRVQRDIDNQTPVEGFGTIDGPMGSFLDHLRVAAIDLKAGR